MTDNARKAKASELAIQAQQAFCASCDLSVEALEIDTDLTREQRAERLATLNQVKRQRTQAYRDLSAMRLKHFKQFPPQPSWASRLIARFARRDRARGAA